MTRYRQGTRHCCWLALMTFVYTSPCSALTPCDDIIPHTSQSRAPARDATPEDILRLRDIGQPDGAMFGQPSPLALSPDKRWLAFIVNRADPDSNSYCRALVMMPAGGDGAPLVLDRGGELITNMTVARGFVVENGFPAVITPAWSPDSRTIAYLRRDHGVTQAWIARADGSGAKPLTQSAVDVLAVAWSEDGKLIYASMPGILEYRRSIEKEGRTGWLYDERIMPNIGPRPRIAGSIPRQAFVVDPRTLVMTPATEAQSRLVPMEDLSGSPIPPSAEFRAGRRAWTAHRDPSPLSPLQLSVTDATGPVVTCASRACDGGFTSLWWTRDGRELIFLRREGWANGQMGLYRWAPGRGEPRQILLTNNVLLGCIMADNRLLCTEENAVTPRRIAAISLDSGRSTPIYDPNPEFASIRLGKVERLKWRNNLGLEAWGDLVLPPRYKAGAKLPLIVIQYHSDGFLRGGTGDEYPIHAFAARGFAVLSVERPSFVAEAVSGIRSYNDVNAVNIRDWAERRSLLSSLLTGIDLAVARGIVDTRRIGVTGLSDGASTARFALINSRRFAAASISTCCVEPRTTMTYGGIAYADAMRAIGYPPASRDDQEFWRPYSMALDARSMRVPLLMQLSDDEYLLALETFTALREYGQPVEMNVFPGEHHIKWQPAHRRAIYYRNLEWFDFWLRSHRNPDPSKNAQYERWEAMRDRLRREGAPAAHPAPQDQDRAHASTSASSIIRWKAMP